jgi:primosomal protein N' (replication factor Y)
MILKAEKRSSLNAALHGMLAHADVQEIPRRNVTVDVDALRLM